MSDPIRVSQRWAKMRHSPVTALGALLLDRLRAGVDVINFAVGEPDLGTPAHICEAAQAAIRKGETRYTDTLGTRTLRDAAAVWLNTAHGTHLCGDDVIVSSGAKQVLFNVFQALLNEGDEVIISTPFWTSYAELVESAGGGLVRVPTKAADGFVPSPELIERAVSARSRALLMPSPTNPTGAIYPEPLIRNLVEIAARHDLVLITDDIYRAFYSDAPPVSSVRLAHEAGVSCVVVDGVSKMYCMTGFRIGFGVAPKQLLKTMGIVQSQTTSCASSISQAAALAALTGSQTPVSQLREEFRTRRRVLLDKLRTLPGWRLDREPQGAFYALPSVSHWIGARQQTGAIIDSELALATYLLDECGVAVMPGSAFEAPGFVRMAWVTNVDRISQGIRRIGDALAKLEPVRA